MKASIRVVVIGGGVIGAASALELARGGRFHVSVVERLPQTAAGSTAASTAIIRQFYRSGESVKLARSGLHVWRDWRGWLGGAPDPPLAQFHNAGALWIFPETSRAKETPHIQECMRLGVQIELLTLERMRERFPVFHFLDEPRVFGMLETEAGYVDMPSLAAQNMMDAALATGNARLYLNAQAVDFSGERRRHQPERRAENDRSGRCPERGGSAFVPCERAGGMSAPADDRAKQTAVYRRARDERADASSRRAALHRPSERLLYEA